MFLTKLKMIAVAIFLGGLSSASAAEFPAELNKCFDQNVSALLTIDRHNRTAMKQLFLRSIDQDMLGRRAFGGRNWRYFSKKEKAIALDLYFKLLFTKGSSLIRGMKDAKNTIIRKRLADHPVVKQGSGRYHIVVQVTLDNGKSVTAAVLVTATCKIYDLGQGGFASRFVNAEDVDLAMRQRRN